MVTVCYELLIGKTVFNAETMNDLVEKVKEGKYKIPSSVSKELVSFLNDMLQYDPNYRLNAKELQKHPFLTKNIKDFSYINTKRVTKDDKIKKNKSIWAIFHEEEKFINIKSNNTKSINHNSIIEEENKIENLYNSNQ